MLNTKNIKLYLDWEKWRWELNDTYLLRENKKRQQTHERIRVGYENNTQFEMMSQPRNGRQWKTIGNIYCMNVCLSTVWSAPAFWFTCMPLSNDPHTPLLTECFCFWCLIVTCQEKVSKKTYLFWIFKKQATYLREIITSTTNINYLRFSPPYTGNHWL